MKRTLSFILIFTLLLAMLLTGCGNENSDDNQSGVSTDNQNSNTSSGSAADLGDDGTTFGERLDDLNAYAGYFEEDTVDVTVNCVSRTENCYIIKENTLIFTSVSEDSVYSVSGKLKGNIVIDTGDDYKFDLELQGLSLVCDTATPVMIISGDEVSITAKSEYENYIYDMRESVDETDDTVYSGAIYSNVDIEICGKGSLTVVSENNNGIHGKNDLEVKNLTLLVTCVDNALKGNDSVEITECSTTLIATKGDGIKTTDSDISEKGNQRGSVTISGGRHSIYAACDGIDAAYNVVIDQDITELNIYTDKYSNYSSEVTAVHEENYYIRFTDNIYKYSVKYYNSDDDYYWADAEYHSCVSGGRNNYYYYSFPKMSEYCKMQFFIYSSDMESGQEEDYLVASDYMTPNSAYDTFALTSYGNSLSYSWTNYTTSFKDNGMGGRGPMGGMQEGNTDKSEYSAKGIKSGNEIIINAGTVSIKAYDDAIHANGNITLENGNISTGNITINGGIVTAYSNDDGLHADGILTVSSGTVSVTNSYEGLEGAGVVISGGNISVISSDDGINGTSVSDTAIEVSGGTVYIYCSGDGFDSNSRTSYSGIVFSGGNTVVISTSSGNSAIDTEQGYKYTGGSVVAIMPVGGMTNEVSNCSNFSSIGTIASVSLNSGDYLTVTDGTYDIVTVKMQSSISATVTYLGNNSADITSESTCSETLDINGVCWNK